MLRAKIIQKLLVWIFRLRGIFFIVFCYSKSELGPFGLIKMSQAAYNSLQLLSKCDVVLYFILCKQDLNIIWKNFTILREC